MTDYTSNFANHLKKNKTAKKKSDRSIKGVGVLIHTFKSEESAMEEEFMKLLNLDCRE